MNRTTASRLVPLLFLAVLGASGSARADVPICSATTVANLLAPATTAGQAVEIACHLTLRPTDVVTKRILVSGAAASGAVIDCNGATIDGGVGTLNQGKDMIYVRSTSSIDPATGVKVWSRPQNVVVRDCHVIGSVRVIGMDPYSEEVRLSSHTAGHATRMRTAAPRYIRFEDMTIEGVGRNPFFLQLGTSYVTLVNSEIAGYSTAVAIYLDAETYRNTIENNYIHTNGTTGDPVMAIDGSSYNRILNNWFSSLESGGIYLYRNCGERRVVRHSTPSHNQIINNVFFYDTYTGSNPAVFLGSRNGDDAGAGYCGDDAGYPYGSSADDRDFARYNVVMQNQIYKRSVSEMIRTRWSINTPNYIGENTTVTAAVERPSGCYVSNGYRDDFLWHGEALDTFEGSMGAPRCYTFGYACNDGDLELISPVDCEIQTVPFSCQASGSNAGCSTSASCPSGTTIIGASAACNLEYGLISDDQLASVQVNTIEVIRASDVVSDGLCFFGSAQLRSGERSIESQLDVRSTTMGCRESDANGGDCHIRGTLYCQ